LDFALFFVNQYFPPVAAGVAPGFAAAVALIHIF